jgi:GT2 family glycosyltransferase
VVFATYKRPQLAARLLGQLAVQDLPPDALEVVVVDDGSGEDVAALLRATPMPFHLVVMSQANRGAAAARDRAIRAARGEVVVELDDDMQVGPAFVTAHLRHHPPGSRRLVLGHILPDPGLARMPLFERYHAAMLARFAREASAGRRPLRGTGLCSGNVSFRRADYLSVGGFDPSVPRAEDVELGIRLDLAGCEVVFAHDAQSVHSSDHSSLGRWLEQTVRYGIWELRIARMHRQAPWAHPFRFLSLVHPLSRPLLLGLPLLPAVGRGAATLVMKVASLADRCGAERLAVAGTTLAYGLLYYTGVRTECGSARATLAELRRHRADARPPSPLPARIAS